MLVLIRHSHVGKLSQRMHLNTNKKSLHISVRRIQPYCTVYDEN